MIVFSGTRYLALTQEVTGAVFSPVRGRGGAHVLTLPSAERPGTDALAYQDGEGRMTAVCGASLSAGNLVPGASREMHAVCAQWLASDAHAAESERTVSAWASGENSAGENPADLRRAAVVREQERLDRQRAARENNSSQRLERTPDPVAKITDGKCSREVTGTDGVTVLVPIHGKNGIQPVPGTVTVVEGGSEAGVCPECRTFVRLTGKGSIPTHRPGNVTADGPVLSQKNVPTVENGTAVADAAKAREEEAYITTGPDGTKLTEKEVRDTVKNGGEVMVVPVVPTAPAAKAAVGCRDHGRSDGVAMTPGDLRPVQPKGKGWAARAGTMALPVGRPCPDAQVIRDVMHGGTFGYLTEADYAVLTRTQQRTYWRNVRTMRDRAQNARAMVTARREALRQQMPVKEARAARKAARVGTRTDGTVSRPVTSAHSK
jgi:hypothetical protein